MINLKILKETVKFVKGLTVCKIKEHQLKIVKTVFGAPPIVVYECERCGKIILKPAKMMECVEI